MANDSIGTARIDIELDTSKVEPGVNRAKQSVASLTTEVEKSSQKQVQASKRQEDALVRQIQQIGKSREEYLRWRIAQQTSGDQAARLNTLLDQQTSSMQRTGVSAAQTAAALRGVPAQLTDIVVGLQGGQAPLTVLLQQGGQLKDMFGGTVPAVRALSGALIGMINPATAAAAAIAALAFAYKSSADESAAFNRSLILSGNYANQTLGSLEAMRDRLDSIAGVTRGSATQALTQVAESGRFTGETFEAVAAAAARMQSSADVAIDSTVDKFREIARDPVDALLKLNETEHFLTEAQFARVRALVEEGDQQGAVSEAARIYATRLEDVANKAEAAASPLSKLWRDLKDEASEAVGELQTYSNLLAKLVGSSLGNRNVNGLGDLLPFMASDQLRMLNSYGTRYLQQRGIISATPAAPAGPGEPVLDSKKQQERDKQAAEWQQLTLSNLSKEEKLRKEINQIQDLGKSLKKDEAEIQKEVAAAQARYKESLPKGRKAQLTDEQKEAKQLSSAFESMNTQLERQIALYGDVSNSSRLNFEIQSGALQGLDQNLQTVLRTQASMLDIMKSMDEVDAYQQEDAEEFARRFEELMGGGAESMREQTDKISTFAEQAGRNIQTYLGDATFDLLDGKFSDIGDSFGNMLKRMMAELAASKILDAFSGWATGYSGAGSSWVNALGGALGASATRNANGGVYSSPSLSSYSSQVVSKPTMFAFAKGAGLMGEAGPEAILPLRRGTDGKLGVTASAAGAGDIKVEVINNGRPMDAEASVTRDMDGRALVQVFLKEWARDMATGGMTASATKGRFDIRERS